jgi:hypothetical protein
MVIVCTLSLEEATYHFKCLQFMNWLQYLLIIVYVIKILDPLYYYKESHIFASFLKR